MKMILRTDYCPLLDVGSYGEQALSPLFDMINDKQVSFLIKTIETIAKERIQVMLDSVFGPKRIKILDLSYVSPKYYNYETDILEFKIEIQDDFIDYVKEDRYINDKFFERIEKQFGCYDGYCSFMPYTKTSFYKGLDGKPNEIYDLEKAIGMYIYNKVKDSAFLSFPKEQSTFESLLQEAIEEIIE